MHNLGESMRVQAQKAVFGSIVFASIFAITACGGNEGESASAPGFAPGSDVLYAVRSGAPLDVCPNGGITIAAGIDQNANASLDAEEVTSTQYVCHGANGSAGADGAAGVNALVTVTSEPAADNCANGGKKISVGTDANGNGMLDLAEVTSSDYVCNGVTGAAGADGINTLVSIQAATVEQCANGGSQVTSGFDTNQNNALDAAEITTTTSVCNGADGADGATGPAGPAGPGVTWSEVTASAVQAQSNNGYLANSGSQVTVTLPAAPAVGDIVQVSGLGLGGWKIAQNAGQTIITRALGKGIGTHWTGLNYNTANWRSIASSADGTKLIGGWSGWLVTSSDAGANWNVRIDYTNRNWFAVASSEDGARLAAADYGGWIYVSTDSGKTWTARLTDANRGWRGITSSANGMTLAAVVDGGHIWISTDGGVTWTERMTDADRQWRSVASSRDGTRLVAGVGVAAGLIYTSTDSGATWTARMTDADRQWRGVASSADGTRLVGVTPSAIYTSVDSGATWTARMTDTERLWTSVASSADGTKLAAVAYGDAIYVSTDSGVTWTPRMKDFSLGWYAIASSADATRLAAVADGVPVFTSVASTTPGTTGAITGGQYDAIHLQYIGNNNFSVLGYAGDLTVQ